MNIVVDGLMTNYEVAGNGKAVLVLHGWGDNIKGLAALRQELAKTHKVIALDLPGFGATQVPDGVWGLDEYGRFTAKFLEKAKLGMPEAIIGHSNGGAVAIRSIATGVLTPKKLVLIAAAGIRDGASMKRMLLTFFAKAGNLATIWLPARHRAALRHRLYGAVGSDLLVVPELEATFKKTVRQDVQKDAATLKLPTLLIYAKNDQAVPVRDGYAYNRLIKGSRLEVIEDAGHFVHLDQAEKTAALIKEFL